MPKGVGAALSFVELIFQNTPWANIADNSAGASTAPLTQLWSALHTAVPTSGSQAINEAAYGGYTRIATTRSSAGWSVTAESSQGAGVTVSPQAAISFPQATSGSETETYFSVGTSSAGAGSILWAGSISPTLAISAGVQPKLTTGTVITES